MADPTLTLTHPLESRRDRLAAVSAELATTRPGALTVALEAPQAMVDLRVDPRGAGPGAVGRAVSGRLPTAADSWTELPAGQALRLGPDEWLLTHATSPPERWERLVDRAAAAHGGTAVDVSAQRTSIRLRGRLVRDLLSSGCALDLRPASAPRGRCAQTLFGQAAVVLVVHDPDDVALLVRPSVAGYVADRLADAALDL